MHRSDRKGNASIPYAERLAANDIVVSVGSKGDSYDKSLAESFNGLDKWELIYRQGPWTGLQDMRVRTMSYVGWFNHRRLHGEITEHRYSTPAEFDAACYRQDNLAVDAVADNTSLYRTRAVQEDISNSRLGALE